jgi:alginate biosynthesis protein AlgK
MLIRFVVLTLLCLLCACTAIKYDEREADELYRAGQVQVAIQHYRYLADFGLSSAQLKLGRLYYSQGQYAQAQYWLKKSEAENTLKARISLARLYGFSEDPDYRDVNKAYAMFIEMLSEGYDSVVSDIVKLYKLGSIANITLEEITALEMRAVSGNQAACYLMARIYRDGGLLQQNINKAHAYYRCAIERYPAGIYELAELFNQHTELGRFEDIHTLLESITVLKANKIKLRIARAIASKNFNQWSDEQAEQLLKEVSQDDPLGFYYLAKLYLTKPLLGKSVDDALNELRKGQAQNNIDCYALEAEMYLRGSYVTQDPWKAEAILKKIPEDNGYVAYLLGDLYVSGYLGPVEMAKGLALLRRAANLSYKKADAKLSKMFFYGRGLKVDYPKAYAHLILRGTEADKLTTIRQHYNMTDDQVIKAKEIAHKIRQYRSDQSQISMVH